MALQMPFTTRHKIPLPNSYWKVANTNFDHVTKSCLIISSCYYDKAARDADPVKNMIDQKVYYPTPDEYDNFFAPSVLRGKPSDPVAQAYTYMKQKLEKNGKSFFDGAIDI